MIPSSPRRSPVYVGTGANTAFPFEFKVFANTDVEVTRADLLGNNTVLTLGADYTVALNSDQDNFPGGTVNTTAPLAEGFRLVATGRLPYQQSTQLPNGGNYNARVVEQALDKLAVQVQQLKENLDRTLRLGVTADAVSVALPSPVSLSVIGWDVAGTALRNFTPGDLGVNVTYAQWQTQLFSGTGAQTQFVLNNDAGSASNIDLRVNNVPQTPNVNYSYDAATRTITFLTGAPASGTNNVVARYGQALPQGTFALGDNTVTGAKLADNTIPTSKYQDDSVTFAKLQNITTARLLGRLTAGAGDVEELTGAQAQALLPVQQTRVDVASAATVNLTTGAAATDHVNITGTTAITAFTVAAGRTVFVRFAGALTLTNNANIVTQTGANIVTQSGDTCTLRATATNVVEVLSYVPAVLNQQTTRSMVRVNTANGHGSTNTCIRRFTTVVTNQGSDITYADSATLGASFTINNAGVYGISYTDSFNTSSQFGVSLNSTQLTTSIGTITAADRLVETNNAASSGQRYTAATTVYLPAGSVIRPHTDGFTGGGANTQFTITRVA